MKKFMIFVAGVAVGSTVTWKLIKDKYAQMAQEEIDSVKEAFSDKKKDDDICEEPDVKENVENSTLNIKKATNIVQRYNYAEIYSAPDKKEEPKEVQPVKKDVEDRPYVISPDDFGELDDYECISLSYYDDGVVTDDNYELVDDIDDVIGLDSLERFGEYEDDSVFVRNDKLKCDYEILLDHRNYSDIIKSMPYLMRD